MTYTLEIKDWRTMTEEEKLDWLENATLAQLLFHFYAPQILNDLDKELGYNENQKENKID